MTTITLPRAVVGKTKRKDDSMKTTTLDILMARRDALRALTYKTDAITAELERLYRVIERELWSASQ